MPALGTRWKVYRRRQLAIYGKLTSSDLEHIGRKSPNQKQLGSGQCANGNDFLKRAPVLGFHIGDFDFSTDFQLIEPNVQRVTSLNGRVVLFLPKKIPDPIRNRNIFKTAVGAFDQTAVFGKSASFARRVSRRLAKLLTAQGALHKTTPRCVRAKFKTNATPNEKNRIKNEIQTPVFHPRSLTFIKNWAMHGKNNVSATHATTIWF